MTRNPSLRLQHLLNPTKNPESDTEAAYYPTLPPQTRKRHGGGVVPHTPPPTPPNPSNDPEHDKDDPENDTEVAYTPTYRSYPLSLVNKARKQQGGGVYPTCRRLASSPARKPAQNETKVAYPHMPSCSYLPFAFAHAVYSDQTWSISAHLLASPLYLINKFNIINISNVINPCILHITDVE
jgi:hypothetical protein